MSLRKRYYAFSCIELEKVLSIHAYFHTTRKNHYPNINAHCHGKPSRKWARRADVHASTRQGPMDNRIQTPFNFCRAWNIKTDILKQSAEDTQGKWHELLFLQYSDHVWIIWSFQVMRFIPQTFQCSKCFRDSLFSPHSNPTIQVVLLPPLFRCVHLKRHKFKWFKPKIMKLVSGGARFESRKQLITSTPV